MEDLVTLIVPVYNVEKYLSKCIESIINQSYKNLEIILIDDESTDNSGIICDEFANLDSRIKVIHKKNEGVSAARNSGLKNATGRYIGFVDSDDYINYNMVEILLNNMKKYHSDISICGYKMFDDNMKILKVSDTEDTTRELSIEETLNLIFKTNKINGFLWNKLFSVEVIRGVLLREDIDLCEDLLMVCQILRKCKKICYTSKKLYNYRSRSNSATSNINKLFYHSGKCKYSTVYENIEKLYSDNKISTIIHLRHIKAVFGSYYLVIKSHYKNKNIDLYTFNFLKFNFRRYIFSSQVSIKYKIICMGIFGISAINNLKYLFKSK